MIAGLASVRLHWRRMCAVVARSVSSPTCVLDPDRFVLGRERSPLQSTKYLRLTARFAAVNFGRRESTTVPPHTAKAVNDKTGNALVSSGMAEERGRVAEPLPSVAPKLVRQLL